VSPSREVVHGARGAADEADRRASSRPIDERAVTS
jgi:hypothetical protein